MVTNITGLNLKCDVCNEVHAVHGILYARLDGKLTAMAVCSDRCVAVYQHDTPEAVLSLRE